MTTVASSRPNRFPADPVTLSLWELVSIFIRTGSLAFGGGGSTLAMLHSEFCVRRFVLSDEEFQLLFGLTRLVPGMNLLSLTVLLGYRTHGLVGSVLSLLGLTVPSFAIIIVGCRVLRGGHPGPFLAGAVKGLSIGACALLVETAWRLCQSALTRQAWRARGLWLALLVGSALLTHVERLSAAWIVLGGGVVGVLLATVVREP